MNARSTLSSLVLVSWLVPLAPALAKTETIVINQAHETAELFVRPGTLFILQLDSPITSIEDPNNPYIRITDPSRLKDPIGSTEVHLAIAQDAYNITSRPVFRTEEYTTTLIVRTSRDDRKVSDGAIIIRARDQRQINEMQAKLHAAAAERDKANVQLTLVTAELTAQTARVRELEQRVRDLTPSDDSENIREEKALLREVDITATMRALTYSTSCKEPGIVVCGKHWAELNQHGILHFTVANNTSADFTFSSVHAFRLDTPGNLAGSVRIGRKDPVAPDKVRGRVPARGQLAVSVILREHEQIGHKLRIELSGPDVQTAIRIVDLDPPPPEPAEGFGRITIRMQPSIGAVWLANPVNKEELDATTLMGLGMRGSYALHRMFAVEGELAGIQSNDANFADVPFEGTTGDVLRSTKGARLLFGGALRLGEKYQPFLRLGFGAQVVDHDVRFIAGQNTTAGPGDGLAFAMLGWFGSGLDIQLGKHWTLGAGLQAIAQTNGATSIEGGVQLGYGWGGYVRD